MAGETVGSRAAEKTLRGHAERGIGPILFDALDQACDGGFLVCRGGVSPTTARALLRRQWVHVAGETVRGTFYVATPAGLAERRRIIDAAEEAA